MVRLNTVASITSFSAMFLKNGRFSHLTYLWNKTVLARRIARTVLQSVRLCTGNE